MTPYTPGLSHVSGGMLCGRGEEMQRGIGKVTNELESIFFFFFDFIYSYFSTGVDYVLVYFLILPSRSQVDFGSDAPVSHTSNVISHSWWSQFFPALSMMCDMVAELEAKQQNCCKHDSLPKSVWIVLNLMSTDVVPSYSFCSVLCGLQTGSTFK